jgi:hypothetical protein
MLGESRGNRKNPISGCIYVTITGGEKHIGIEVIIQTGPQQQLLWMLHQIPPAELCLDVYAEPITELVVAEIHEPGVPVIAILMQSRIASAVCINDEWQVKAKEDEQAFHE